MKYPYGLNIVWRYMERFRLRDWNDIRLIIACAEYGGFAGAAAVLGVDQKTVSRRIGEIEKTVNRPLFHRRQSGAVPTIAGQLVLEQAKATERSVGNLENLLIGLEELPPPTVIVGASEGILTYTLVPVLLRSSSTPQPLDHTLVRGQLPPLAFTTDLSVADVSLFATSTDALPSCAGSYRIRKVGNMHFQAALGRSLAQKIGRSFDSFEEMVNCNKLLDVEIYKGISSLDQWHEVISQKKQDEVCIKQNTILAHRALVRGEGLTILPSYSPMYDNMAIMYDFIQPDLSVSLWLVAHEDKLREPAIRNVYDALVLMFVSSPWFRSALR